MPTDFYEVLGIGRSASEAEIKTAYRQLARKHHPDVNEDKVTAEARFKEINEAYEVLKDGEKRAAYDRFGHAAFEQGGGGPGFGAGFASSFSDIFEDLFGMAGQRGRSGGRERGADLPPLPTLFVVVDEFAELLQSYPDFIGLVDRICRVGRSLRVHLLLATQSLQTGGARIDKLEPNLTYRIALRTTSSHESKSVIGTPEAQYITNKESGVGFLRVGMEDPIKFSTLYTGATYVPPTHVETNGDASVDGSRGGPRAFHTRQFTAGPMLEEAGPTLDEAGAPHARGGVPT